MAAPPAPSGTCEPGLWGLVDCSSGTAGASEGMPASGLASAIVASIGSFGAQLLVFMILRLRLSRIYRPRSYLVPEKERVPPPPGGLFGWLVPLFKTSNLSFIQKCGLDAYFFLRYLRMLLKIFLPIAVIILPILLPLNSNSGEERRGLDRLAISNVAPRYREHRLWAHLLLAVGVTIWVIYVIYRELRGYIRVRQAFLTSPEHRIRASATTVLVTGIPRKWLTLEALNGLYDVFPGGIRNIWINRNFDDLATKVKTRESLAKNLETAETNLIKLCRKKHLKAEKKRRKQEGKSKKSKKERRDEQNYEDQAAEQMAQGQGTSAGDQHDTAHGLQDMLHDAEEDEKRRSQLEARHRTDNPLGFVGDGLGAIGGGIGHLGKGVLNLGKNMVGDANKEFHEAHDDTEQKIHRANMGQGFVTDDELYRDSQYMRDSRHLQDSVPPTPPPKSSAGPQDATQRTQFDGSRDGPRIATVVPGASSNKEYSPAGESDRTHADQTPRTTGPSLDSTKPKSAFQVQEPASHQPPVKKWQIWKKKDQSIPLPSPEPHVHEEDEFPLNSQSNRANKLPDLNEKPDQGVSGSKWAEKVMFWKRGDGGHEPEPYPKAHNDEWDKDQDEEPYWRRYIEPKDRETMRLPVIFSSWFPSLPLVGPKVDKIYWLRRELARLNLEIEMDQADVEKFPFMNSAFIQFNHQVAAHMACQSVTHHVPQHMAPRLVEISPDDVLWDNMSIKWWERYLRTGVVLAISVALIVFYAIPVSFTSLLSKISTVAELLGWDWLNTLPEAVQGIITSVLPPVLLAIILALVPIIFRVLVKQQGVPTGNSKELGVQQWYFAFLFIQVFLIVTISGGLTTFITTIAENPTEIVSSLAETLPSAATYFFSYLMIQALSNSASNLLQVAALAMWFLLGPILDSTARAKWQRQTTLARVQWGSFFPPFTNFAVIGIIYSVIAPLILVFMLIIFSLFWLVYRYNVLYVYQFRNDTGGLLFPAAVNQLFVGLYVMELCLVGYFFISTNEDGRVVCAPQAGIMIVCLAFTVLFQWLMNSAFKPLFQYLPITLEDEAVIRDEEFARAQASKFAPLRSPERGENDDRDIQDVLEGREQREEEAEQRALEQEMQNVEEHRRSKRYSSANNTPTSTMNARGWHQNGPRGADRWKRAPGNAIKTIRNAAYEKPVADGNAANPQTTKKQDIEAQKTVGDVLFSGFADELEDLTPEERDLLVRYAFQHSALRAKRPVVWIPRDKLGVSDDEIRRAKRMSTVKVEDGEKGTVEKTNIWMSNEGTALDGKGRVVFRRSPPDFSNVDLIAL